MSIRLLKGPFTVDDYHRLGELGVLTEDDRVELLDGQIVQMSPIGSRHAGRVNHINHLLYRRLGDAVILAIQNPVALSPTSEPQPDIAVLKPRPDAYSSAHPHPGDVLLLIEVADTSLESDREVKFPLYSEAGIPEAWLVDIGHDAIEVHREPGPGGYRDVRRLGRGDSVTPTQLPTGEISVDEVLGPLFSPG